MRPVINRADILICDEESCAIHNLGAAVAFMLRGDYDKARGWLPTSWALTAEQLELVPVSIDDSFATIFARIIEAFKE